MVSPDKAKREFLKRPISIIGTPQLSKLQTSWTRDIQSKVWMSGSLTAGRQ